MTAQVGTGTLAEGDSGWFDKLAQYRAVWSSPDFITSVATILLIAAAWLVSLGGIGIGLPVDDASWLARLAGSETDWLAPALGLAGVVIGGAKIAVGALRGLLERELNVDELVTIAIVAAVILGEYLSAGLVAFMMLFGKVLEDFTAERAELALAGLGALLPATARRKGDQDTEEEVPLSSLRQGDIVIIRPGERLPIDGVVMAGQAAVDQAALTGEPVPQPRGPGDEVLAGGLAHQGALEVRTTRIGAATAIGRIRQLVTAAEEERAPVVRRADYYAKFFTPAVLALAAAVLLFTYLITGAWDWLPAVTVLSSRGMAIASQVLGLRDDREARMVRPHDRVTGEDLPTYEEADRAREEEATARHSAESRAAELEARVLALEKTLAARTRQHPE